MPTYNYQCKHCGYEFEMVLSMKENDRPESEPCPCCLKIAVKQIIVIPTPLGDPHRMGLIKPDDTWKGFLKDLKKKNPGCSDFNTF